MNGRSLAEIVERQLEVASLSGEVDAVMQGIVDRLMENGGGTRVRSGDRTGFHH